MILAGLLGLVLGGCDARYDRLFPAVVGLDASVSDASAGDNGSVDLGTATVLATGEWEGRSGYNASGTVTLVRLEDGTLEVAFSNDFEVSGVPAPVVLLTDRPAVTDGVNEGAGDMSLGPLTARTGFQRYAAPASAADARYVFVYCLPFTVEVARAQLVRAP